jgi:hypothetical protein
MATKLDPSLEISHDLVDALRSFPVSRDVEHCQRKFQVSPFDFYAICPECGTRMKVRSFSSATELEDVFDAVFEWMNAPQAREAADKRRAVIIQEAEDEAAEE